MKSAIDLYVIEKVKARRTELKLSQAEIARRLDVSIGFVGMAESSKYETHYNLQHLNKLALILECSPKDFLPEQAINI
jgi:transcriptional regulator with XRE-family HTH domain